MSVIIGRRLSANSRPLGSEAEVNVGRPGQRVGWMFVLEVVDGLVEGLRRAVR
jgi:hypothetical protein